MNHRLLTLFTLILLQSCSSKKNILYVQDIDRSNLTELNFEAPTIQANDILKINVTTLEALAAIPYNKFTDSGSSASNLELRSLEGYEVSKTLTIEFPQLGFE